MKNIAIIGFGSRGSDVLQSILTLGDGRVRLSALADIRPIEELKQQCPALQSVLDDARLYADYNEMLDKEDLDGVIVATQCSLHGTIARKVIERGIPMFLEKPVVTTRADYELLREVCQQHNDKTVVSFPLRMTRMVRRVKEIIDSGEAGQIEHVQAFNYVPYGGVYYHNWYRDFAETGGLFLQKATHDFDYINYILGFRPVQLYAMESQQIFKGDRPYNLKCSDCEEYYTCPESPFVLEKFSADTKRGDFCCYSKGLRHHDSASVLVRYDTGMHLSYTQNFFVRKSVARRGAVFSGYRATVEFDWGTNEITVHSHHAPEKAVYKYENEPGHGGGDTMLCKNFIDVVMGTAKSEATLESGLLSALMCLAASESVENNTAVDLQF